MNSNKKTYFSDTDIYSKALCGIVEYSSAERRSVEEMLNMLWADDSGVNQWKLDVLHCYLSHKDDQEHRLPAVSLYNYMI